mmetsp:Transcript_85365/g.241817  ORF Transcript_85365/g.241817 Transcript_85365/m.241817 type:complete len:84 (+) Transcript_85365:766-1017(+)
MFRGAHISVTNAVHAVGADHTEAVMGNANKRITHSTNSYELSLHAAHTDPMTVVGRSGSGCCNRDHTPNTIEYSVMLKEARMA